MGPDREIIPLPSGKYSGYMVIVIPIYIKIFYNQNYQEPDNGYSLHQIPYLITELFTKSPCFCTASFLEEPETLGFAAIGAFSVALFSDRVFGRLNSGADDVREGRSKGGAVLGGAGHPVSAAGGGWRGARVPCMH